MSATLQESGEGRGHGKSAAAFRTISEVALDLDVAQHVLRFWESKFPQVKPLKRGGGRRYYRPEDVDLLRQIRSLLYEEGYTIRGVQKLLKTRRTREDGEPAATPAVKADVVPAPTSDQPAADQPAAAVPTVEQPAITAEAADAIHDNGGWDADQGARLRQLRDQLVDLRDRLRLADADV